VELSRTPAAPGPPSWAPSAEHAGSLHAAIAVFGTVSRRRAARRQSPVRLRGRHASAGTKMTLTTWRQPPR
jgi:hypothetical protein